MWSYTPQAFQKRRRINDNDAGIDRRCLATPVVQTPRFQTSGQENQLNGVPLAPVTPRVLLPSPNQHPPPQPFPYHYAMPAYSSPPPMHFQPTMPFLVVHQPNSTYSPQQPVFHSPGMSLCPMSDSGDLAAPGCVSLQRVMGGDNKRESNEPIRDAVISLLPFKFSPFGLCLCRWSGLPGGKKSSLSGASLKEQTWGIVRPGAAQFRCGRVSLSCRRSHWSTLFTAEPITFHSGNNTGLCLFLRCWVQDEDGVTPAL